MHWRTYEETAKEREKARSRPASASPPLGEFFALALSTAAKSETNKATIARLCIPISNCAGPAKRFNRSLQSLHGGEPKGYRRRMKAAKRLGQRRNTLSITAGIPRRPSKPWLDEHTKRPSPTGSTATTVLVAVSITDTVLSPDSRHRPCCRPKSRLCQTRRSRPGSANRLPCWLRCQACEQPVPGVPQTVLSYDVT
jgi:hypothetical protein